jgi:hypothetical protein
MTVAPVASAASEGHRAASRHKLMSVHNTQHDTVPTHGAFVPLTTQAATSHDRVRLRITQRCQPSSRNDAMRESALPTTFERRAANNRRASFPSS